jgi:hypothetical protein
MVEPHIGSGVLAANIIVLHHDEAAEVGLIPAKLNVAPLKRD